MKLLVDGVEVPFLNDVKIIYDVPQKGEGPDDQLQLCATNEGLIADLLCGEEDGEAVSDLEYMDTACYPVDSLCELFFGAEGEEGD